MYLESQCFFLFFFKLDSKEFLVKVSLVAIILINILSILFIYCFHVGIVFHGCQHMLFICTSIIHVISIISMFRFCNLSICLIASSTTLKISTPFKFPNVVFVHFLELPKSNPCQSHPNQQCTCCANVCKL